ncbi:MAG: alcohol dehydrogenase catalytic domain-containing protein [Thermomicrobiales bacterium]
MNAPHFEGEGRIGWRQREVPDPGPGQLLVKVAANALCGSDRHQYLHGTDIVPGHEATGTVVEAGASTSVAPGVPGAIFLMDFCGECRNCRMGKTDLCLAKRADMGFTHDGGYGEYIVCSESIFFPVSPETSLVDATLLLDVMGTGGHAIDCARLVHPDIQSVLVCGAGPIGLGVLAMAKTILGHDIPVLITDFVPYRLDLAAKLGGIPVNLAKQDLAETLRENGLPLADVAVDTSGRSASRRAALDVLAKPGGLVCVGHGESITLDVSRDLISQEHAVLGSEYFPFADMAANYTRLQANPDYFRQIITHVMDIESLPAAYEAFFGGDTGKVVVTHDR